MSPGTQAAAALARIAMRRRGGSARRIKVWAALVLIAAFTWRAGALPKWTPPA